jgi:hypothetical protein
VNLQHFSIGIQDQVILTIAAYVGVSAPGCDREIDRRRGPHSQVKAKRESRSIKSGPEVGRSGGEHKFESLRRGFLPEH